MGVHQSEAGSLISATATFALNAGLWFRRGRLAIVFYSLAASCRCCADNPLIRAVQISGATSHSINAIRIGYYVPDAGIDY
jgi:hypothetical protein